MSWSYSGDPSTSDRDKVRYLIGDTDATDQQESNEEIAWLLTIQSDPFLAAALACEMLVSRYARLVDKTVGDLSISYSQRQDAYRKQADKLRQEAALTTASTIAAPYAGGISQSDKEIDTTDTDRTDPAIFKGMHDYQKPLGDSDVSED